MKGSLQTATRASTGFGWTKADAYLFDIDGTLLVTRDGVQREPIHRAMREVYGVDTTIEGIAYHGMTDLGILRAALARVGISSAEFESKRAPALAVVTREVAANEGRIAPQVFAAIPELLEELHKRGKLLGMASGNLESVGWRKVRTAGLSHYFAFGCFSDQHEERADIFRAGVAEARKRLGNDATICFFGDTPSDILAARSAGAQIVAVCTGIFSYEQLSEHGPDVCIASCAELRFGE